jgi:membrane protease YdiL (CAAX protease family)
VETEDRIPEGTGTPIAPAATSSAPPAREIGLPRALGEIIAVYVPSFGLGVFTALVLLHNPDLGNNDEITGWLTALEEILQYVMQASVTIFGVAFFCVQRGVTLPMLFGKPKRPAQPDPAAPGWPGYGFEGYGYPGAEAPQPQQSEQQAPPSAPAPQWGQPPQPSPTEPISPEPTQPVSPVPAWGAQQPSPSTQPVPTAYGFAGNAPVYFPGVPRPPQERGRGWQFARAYFISMAGVLGFLISVVVYTQVTHRATGAPDQGSSPWLLLVGLVVALAAGFGEEMLITGLVTNALEKAGMTGSRAWVIYLVAICLRVPFHLYYGWASLGVIIFTVVNIWVYRRWRLLWPIILAHATYDFVEYAAGVVPQTAGGLMILGLGLGTLVMLIIILSVENSDRLARRRYARFAKEQGLLAHYATAPVNG